MIILGLTGSIATGKSTVAKLCHTLWHIPIWDADHDVKRLLKTRVVQNQLKISFPHVFCDDKLDRGALRRHVFANAHELRLLESILYPYLLKNMRQFIHYHTRRRTPLIIIDVPLLLEKGWSEYCDYVMVATCKEHLQKQRILKRAGMTNTQMNQILAQQFPQHIKRKRADFEVKTDLSKRYTVSQVENILHQIILEGGDHA